MNNKKISKFAIASFISSLIFIVGFLGLLNLIPSLYNRLLFTLSCCFLAIIFGISAIIKIKKNKEKLKGFGLSMLGIIFASIYMFIIFSGMSNQIAYTGKTIRNDLASIETALDLYEMDHGMYPLNEYEFDALSPYYIANIPPDPWGNKYQYSFSVEECSYKLFSLGKDGVRSKDDIYLND